MAIVSTPKSFDKKFAFKVAISGFTSMAFQKCSELSMEIAEIEHYEGGSLVPTKSAGRVKFPPITLERGVGLDVDFYAWAVQTANAPGNLGGTEYAYKRHVDILQLDRDGSVLKKWTLFNAFPTKFVAGMWDNGADENVIESLTLSYEYFIRTR